MEYRVLNAKRQSKAIGDTGLSEMIIIPETPDNGQLLSQVMPKNAPGGYELRYEYTSVEIHGKPVPAVRLWMEKIAAGAPGAAPPTEDALVVKTMAELAELAVTLGVTDATVKWSKAKLISEIQKAQALQTAGA